MTKIGLRRLCGVVGGVVVAAIGIIATPFTGGVSLAAVAAGLKIAGAAVVGGLVVGYIAKQNLPQDFYLPMYAISPAEIFSGKIAMLDVNFFNPNEYERFSSIAGNGDEQISTAAQLQSVISKWYFTLRNFAVVALLSILVYTGIRIIISSSAQDKAKYKQRLLDWLIAMCLLFFLHYIMAFAVTITELITESLNVVNKDYVEIIGSDESLEDYRWDFKQRQDVVDDSGTVTGEEVVTVDSKVFDSGSSMYQQLKSAGIIQSGSIQSDGTVSANGEMLAWPTNLMGKARIEAQLLATGEDEDGDNTLIRQFGYTVIFLALVIYTILFLFRYLKRLLMLAFLTIIAPFVAMTYPLDKMSDGSAQAFNTWLKEYVYNLLIQPVHLILYTILIGSAMDFAASNLLYALAALGFILQAEKIMRKFFGFEKASTLAGGSALGGALAMQGLNMLSKAVRGKGGKKGGSGNSGGSGGKNDKINYKRPPDKGKSTDDLLNDTARENSTIGENSTPRLNEGATTPDAADRELTNEEKMLEAYDELYGTDAWDAQERDAMAREAAASRPSEPNQISKDEYEQILRDSGYEEDEIQAMIADDPRFAEQISTQGENTATPTTLPQPNRSEDNSIRKPKTGRILGAAKVAAKGAKYLAPKAARLAMKGTMAGTGAMIGLAAGLVSDDFGNVGKWTAAGAGTGWVAGAGVASIPGRAGESIDEATDFISNAKEDAASTYTLTAYGTEAEKERKKQQDDKRVMKDKERRQLYENKLKLNKQQAIEAMKEAQKYRESGITDDEIIIKAMKSEQFGTERASKEKIILAGLASEVGKDKKQLEYVQKELGKKGISSEDIEKYTAGIKEINDWTIQ